MLGHRTLNVEDYLAILKHRWWIIAVPALILPILAVGASYLLTPQYVSSSLVLIDQQKVSSDYVKAVGTEALDTRLAYMTAKILSRSSIEPIINHYNLYGDQHLSMDARIDLVRTKGLKIAAEHSEIAASNGLPGFRITFTASDPHTAQQVCSEITGLFTSENLKFRQDQADDSTSFLRDQLDNAKRTLDDQDKKIADFQTLYLGMLPGDQTNNVGVLSSLNSRLDAITQAISTLQQQKSMGDTLLSSQLAQSSPTAAAASKTPQNLQAQLDVLETKKTDLLTQDTPDNPDVKALNRAISDVQTQMAKAAAAPQPTIQATPAASRSDAPNVVRLRAEIRGIDVQLLSRQKEQSDLNRQIQGYESKIQSSPEVAEKYTELTRDSETDLANYNALKAKMDNSQATTALENRMLGETFQVLDGANLPPDPIFPKQTVFAGAGVAAGIALGLLIIALLEYKDTALRTEREIWDFTHLPTLAVIAWSGETAAATPTRAGRIRRLFSRKPSKDKLADAQG
jgi:polysaccharide chain length determinant protein (PEP-CTERM system associated)